MSKPIHLLKQVSFQQPNLNSLRRRANFLSVLKCIVYPLHQDSFNSNKCSVKRHRGDDDNDQSSILVISCLRIEVTWAWGMALQAAIGLDDGYMYSRIWRGGGGNLHLSYDRLQLKVTDKDPRDTNNKNKDLQNVLPHYQHFMQYIHMSQSPKQSTFPKMSSFTLN